MGQRCAALQPASAARPWPAAFDEAAKADQPAGFQRAGARRMPRGIFLIFLAVGVAIAGGSSYYYAMAWSWVQEGRSWPTSPGTIVAIAIEDHAIGENGPSSKSSYPWLTYTYRIGNRTLTGNRI